MYLVLVFVQVPGYLPPPQAPRTPERSSSERPPSGPTLDGIKKEQLEFGGPATSRASPAQSGGSEKCLTPKTSSTPTPQVISQTPPLRQPPSSPHSAINLISPGSSTGSIGGSATPSHSAVSLPAPHPAQPHASYPGSMPPPHLMHPPFLHVSFHIKNNITITFKLV